MAKKEKSELTVGAFLDASAIQFNHDAETVPEALGISRQERDELGEILDRVAPMDGRKDSEVIESILRADLPTKCKVWALYLFGQKNGGDKAIRMMSMLRGLPPFPMGGGLE